MRGITSLSDSDKQISSLSAVDNAISVLYPENVMTHPRLDCAVNGLFIAVVGFQFHEKSALA